VRVSARYPHFIRAEKKGSMTRYPYFVRVRIGLSAAGAHLIRGRDPVSRDRAGPSHQRSQTCVRRSEP